VAQPGSERSKPAFGVPSSDIAESDCCLAGRALGKLIHFGALPCYLHLSELTGLARATASLPSRSAFTQLYDHPSFCGVTQTLSVTSLYEKLWLAMKISLELVMTFAVWETA
jgi:hypothetical protein